jgi:SulP family sulfate permease
MAYALIIGINPIYGLITSIISMVLGTVFGVSNYLIVGPTNIMAIAIASSLSTIQGGNYLSLVFVLTFLIGLCQLLLGIFKLGNLVNYISHPVIVGLTTGVVLIICLGQIDDFLGLNMDSSFNLFTGFFQIVKNYSQINTYSLCTGLVTIAIIIIFKKINPRIPAYLGAIMITIFIVFIFNLDAKLQGIEQFSTILPTLNPISLNLNLVKKLFSSALSIAILGFIQIVSIVKSLEEKSGEDVELNREFIGQGLINIICSFFNCFAVPGSFTRSFVNYDTGARTRVSQFFTALFLLLFILILSPVIKYIPVPSLSAVVIMAAIKMIDIPNIVRSLKTTKFDAVVLIVTFMTTILAPRLDYAIYFGVLVSIILMLRNTSYIDYSHIDYNGEEDEEFLHESLQNVQENDFIVINLGGNFHFNSAENLKKELNESFCKNKDFIIRVRDVENIDITSLKELEKFIEKVQNNGGDVFFSGVNDSLYKSLQECGIREKLKKEIYLNQISIYFLLQKML